ncbi:uncharacterized protein PAC_18435 [Phialocephala subalpina]|uniref:Uncharacterized protein n=1 Tax=Phialocephala subalpina TaxID=576137 RepID=A0A1L7XU26_9HELO|nr:uncharacterized protein PAC_18435 [Phialocephala subalpina]
MSHDLTRTGHGARQTRKVLKGMRRKIRRLLRKLLPTWHAGAREVAYFVQEMPFNPDPSLFEHTDPQINYEFDQGQRILDSFDRIRNKIGDLPQTLLNDLPARQMARRIEWFTKKLYSMERGYAFASYNGQEALLTRRLAMLEEDLDVDIEAVRRWLARGNSQDERPPPVYEEGMQPPAYDETPPGDDDPPPYQEG